VNLPRPHANAVFINLPVIKGVKAQVIHSVNSFLEALSLSNTPRVLRKDYGAAAWKDTQNKRDQLAETGGIAKQKGIRELKASPSKAGVKPCQP